jgi:multiple sugar transport system permease protein
MRPSLWSRILHSDSFAGWGFAGPAIFLILGLSIFPIVWGILLSFQKNNLLGGAPQWVGVHNYQELFKDPNFRKSVWHTILYTVCFVPLSIASSLLIAVAMNRKMRFLTIYRVSVFVTLAISTIATAVLFLWLTDPTYGLINDLLTKVGLHSQQFLAQPETSPIANEALYVIVAMDVWGWLGFNVVIYLAALQGIPTELLEAAEIDGAKAWKRFWHITRPLLGTATVFLTIWLTINAFQLFDEVYLTTRGGPLYSTAVVVYYLFDKAFTQFDAGVGAAAGWVLFVVIGAVGLIEWKISKRAVYTGAK